MARDVSPRIMKRQLYEARFQSLFEAVRVANAEMLASMRSEDFAEGVAHFVERRKARSTGR